MEKLTKEILQKAARNVMVDMSEEEYNRFLSNAQYFENNLAILEDFEISSDVEPMVFPYKVNGELYEFNAAESINKDDAFKNSSCYKNGELKIRKAIK